MNPLTTAMRASAQTAPGMRMTTDPLRAPIVRIHRLGVPFVVLAGLLGQGCVTAVRQKAVPLELHTKATVTGFPDGSRYFPRDAEDLEQFQKNFVESWEREKKYMAAQGSTGALPPAAYLAISGGGDNGAFGAGLLNGWTKAGTRPTFKLVTGVSTGALISPFAFLGPDYDARLKEMYTAISMKDIANVKSILSAVYGESMADTTPLWNLLKKSVTQEMLDAIAAEHEKGRILLVGTTNLDVRRPVIWNITKIAASHRPGALELVHKILLASAAIPGTFPPVMIKVEAEGKSYDEMHVDGGTATQAFVYPAGVRMQELSQKSGVDRERRLYVIRNARLDPEWAEVDRRAMTIAVRAITCLIQYQGLGDLYRTYSISERDGVDYNLAYIPPTFQIPHTTEFDAGYMRPLFDLAYGMAEAGYPWEKRPPILASGQAKTQP
jgi:predicted acylesterase/phospholipase RssA